MKLTESDEGIKLKLNINDSDSFRDLIFEVFKATKSPGFSRLQLTDKADLMLNNILTELTK